MVALASSAGGLKALSALLSALPADFPAAIAVVQHLAPTHQSMMAHILGAITPLKVKQAAEGDKLHPGTVYIAPPDHHLSITANETVSLSKTEPPVHFVRPSADVLFESMASSLGDRAIAVVLTGTGTDGAKGLRAVKAAGGKVIVQDVETAEFSGMPMAALHGFDADYVLPLENIAGTLMNLVNGKR